MITLSAIRAMQMGSRLWDQGTGAAPGFHARRQNGAAITYLLKYHIHGKARWHTIGRHGAPWTPETARAEARRLLGAVASGADPAAERNARKSEPTVADLARRFIAEHAETKCKPGTAKEYRRQFETNILPALGSKRVADVTRADVAKLHHARRGTPTDANRTLGLLSVLFNWAERIGERPDGSNPCRHAERFPQRRRERFLSADELARLGDTLAAYEGSPYHVATIKLLIFTGARLGEVLGLRWEWIDFGRCCAREPRKAVASNPRGGRAR